MANSTNFGSLDLLVFQGTPLCNINCRYCYLPDRSNNKILPLDIIKASMKAIIENGFVNKDFTILWHAGEPLTLPIEYYKSAFHIISEFIPKDINVSYCFQTNATLLSRPWCDFILERNLEVGISLDGPKFLNDLNRLNKAGKSTFEQTLKGVRLLKEYNYPINIISVVTDDTIDSIDEFFDFFCSLEINKLSLNIEEIEGYNSSSSFSKYTSLELMERLEYFFTTLFARYLDCNKPFKLREYEWASERILFANLKEKKPNFSELTTPFSTITIDINGNFTTFSPELITQKDGKGKDFIIGNFKAGRSIEQDRYDEIFLELTKGIEKCKTTCEYYCLCGGGTPSNKNSEFGTLDVAETKFCVTTVKAPINSLLKLCKKKPFNITMV
jgi:uncharacterized protein